MKIVKQNNINNFREQTRMTEDIENENDDDERFQIQIFIPNSLLEECIQDEKEMVYKTIGDNQLLIPEKFFNEWIHFEKEETSAKIIDDNEDNKIKKENNETISENWDIKININDQQIYEYENDQFEDSLDDLTDYLFLKIGKILIENKNSIK